MFVDATAGDGCEHPVGSTREVMIVAQDDDEEAAHKRALGILHQHGWITAVIKRQAPLDLDAPLEPGYLKNAVLEAVEHGAQIIVYDR
jgi:hypothetical protein